MASAQTWTGATSADWNTATNWSTGTVPTGSVTINSNGTNSPTIYQSDASVSLLSLGNGAGDVQVTVQNGRQFTSNLVTLGFLGRGTIVIQGLGSSFSVPTAVGYLRLGDWSGGYGSVEVYTGASASSASGIAIGSASGASGRLVVDGAGSQWTGNVTVGDAGSGTLAVTAGGKVTGAQIRLGSQSSGIGSATIDGVGTKLTATAALFVGANGRGTLNLQGGAQIESGSAVIGSGAGSFTSTASLTGDSGWINSGSLTVGASGLGTLTLSNTSSWQNAGTVTLAQNAGSVGTLTLNGGYLQAAGGFVFGAGTSTVNLAGGALLVGGSDGLRSSTGSYTINWGGGTVQTDGASLTTAVNFTLSSGTTSTLLAHNYDATLSGLLGGTGALRKTGDATLTLSAGNTYSGGTSVEAGTLKLAASGTNSAVGTGALTIGSAATLAGTGLVAASTSTIQGTLAPGDAGIGSLTFNHALTLASTSALQLELASAASYDQLVLGGAFTAGGTLNVDLLGGFAPTAGTTFHVFDLASPATGTFSALNLAALGAGLSWDTSQLYSTGQLSVTTSAVPEPAACALLIGLAAIGIVSVRRHGRRRRT